MKKPTPRERDTQRARVYAADKAIIHLSRRDVSEVPLLEAYVARVWANKRLRKAYPQMVNPAFGGPPKVFDGRGRSRRAGGNDYAVWMPRWARFETTLCHELAHTITQRQFGYVVAAHGWQYCTVYLAVIRAMLGSDTCDTLKKAFKANRVRYTAPRKQAPLSQERRAELVARMAAIRAQRPTGKLAAGGR